MTAAREALLARLQLLLGREEKLAVHLRGEDPRDRGGAAPDGRGVVWPLRGLRGSHLAVLPYAPRCASCAD
jgi:hypothetical protein